MSRRLYALALVLVCSLQTTGAASASTLSAPNMQPLLAALSQTWIFAAITGQSERYAAMHAPAPVFPKHANSRVGRPDLSASRFAGRTDRTGTPGKPPPMLAPRLLALPARPDPLAMSVNASPLRARSGVVRLPVLSTSRTNMRVRALTANASSALSAATTGINPWWEYEEHPIAGVGKAMVNVGTGNLVVQADDVDVPERGLDLVFRRTYNSQSQHDVAGTDGAVPSLYGNGWTNTFDMHIAYNSTANVISVYDLDGARYDFKANGSGGWTAPPGIQATTLTYDGGCGYQWRKKNGAINYFWSPIGAPWGATCTNGAGYRGRLYALVGHDYNNVIYFNYSWTNNDSSSSQNVHTIAVQHTDGQQLILTFAMFGTNNELWKITLPDGTLLATYNYDNSGNLASVTRPGNATDEATRTLAVTNLFEEYWYFSGTHEMQYVAGPRYFVSAPVGAEGGYYGFGYDANTTSGHLGEINDVGVMNFVPSDGTGTALQPAPAPTPGVQTFWRATYFNYTISNSLVQSTQMLDWESHETEWTIDESSRVTMRKNWSGTAWLVSNEEWDPNNSMTVSIDPRSNQTDYAYDLNGNTIAAEEPAPSTGAARPIATYSYDPLLNNLESYCDPVKNGTSVAMPADPGPDNLCTITPGSGAAVYQYSANSATGLADANVPFGRLVDTYTPLGYHHHITYDSNNYELPVMVQGDPIPQSDPNYPTRQPTQTFGYDSTGYGNLTSYNKGNGAWTLTYDSLNRVMQRTDPDNVSSYICYNPDNSVSLTRTASQFAADGGVACSSINPAASAGVSMTYDANANVISEKHHHGCTALSGCPAGVTKKWYDASDRLVEVEQPQDGNDAYAFPWYTRYIYDLSWSAPQSITGGAQNFLAYGNLYKTQECIQATSVSLKGGTLGITSSTSQPINVPSAPTVTGGCTFQDIRGNTFDALDRSTAKYEVAAGAAPEQTSIYDTNGEYGLLSEKTNPLNQADTLTYDDDGRLTNETFIDGVTPNRSYAYDPDGRVVALTSTTLGTQTKTYDADGRLIGSTDPTSEQDPGTITYGYYADGMRQSLSLSVPALGFSQSNLYTYNYRPDGQRSSLVTAMGAHVPGTFAWTYTSAGRELTQTDPATGAVTNGAEATGPYNPSYTLVAKSFTYDAYGRVASLTLPRGAAGGTESGYYYDLEDGTVGTTWGSYQISTRDEVSGFGFKGVQYANGAMCVTATQCSFDSRSGQMLTQQENVSSGSTVFVALHQYVYDSAGRQTQDSLKCGATSPMTATRSYDSDNHIVQQAWPALFSAAFGGSGCGNGNANQMALSYSWGADGKLANFVTTQWVNAPTLTEETGTSAAHWDGDDLLYVSDSSNNLQLYIEKLGVMWYATNRAWPLDVYDRDQTGTAINMHFLGTTTAPSTAGFTVLELDNVHPFISGHCGNSGGPTAINSTQVTCSGSGSLPQPPTSGGPSSGVYIQFNPILSATREDGYFDGTLSLQGVRAYDPNTNQWTTPDAYAGDVHDPMSQHPYMWNDNNPIEYSDPSGYEPLEGEGENLGSLEELEERAKIVTYGQEEKIAIGRQVAQQSGVPSTWKETTNPREGGVTYTSPTSKTTQVRIMPGKSTSPYPTSRMPYVRATLDGKSLDKNGNIVPEASEASHIPISEFKFQRVMPQKPGNPKTSVPPQ